MAVLSSGAPDSASPAGGGTDAASRQDDHAHLPHGRPLTVTEALAERLGVPRVAVVFALTCLLGLPILPYLFPDREVSLWTTVYLPDFGQIHDLRDVLYQGLLLAAVAFSLHASSYILDRVWRLPSEAPWFRDEVQPEVERTVAAGRRPGPPLIISFIILLPMFAQYISGGYLMSAGDWAIAAAEVAIVVGRFFVMFTLIWCYVRSLVGLTRVSRDSLTLQPAYLDPWLGTRPLGSLALSLAIAYLLLLTLGASMVTSGRAAELMVPVVVVLTIIGVVLFFWPLWRVHLQMAQEKARERAWLQQRTAAVAAVSRHQPEPAVADLSAALRETMAVGIAERRIADIRTWPIDASILARLASVVALPLVMTVVERQLILSVFGI